MVKSRVGNVSPIGHLQPSAEALGRTNMRNPAFAHLVSLVTTVNLLVATTVLATTAQNPILAPSPGSPTSVPPRQAALVSGNNRFALDLYAKVRDQSGNLFLSPYSISSA